METAQESEAFRAEAIEAHATQQQIDADEMRQDVRWTAEAVDALAGDLEEQRDEAMFLRQRLESMENTQARTGETHARTLENLTRAIEALDCNVR